jgi:hypothetical protein
MLALKTVIHASGTGSSQTHWRGRVKHIGANWQTDSSDQGACAINPSLPPLQSPEESLSVGCIFCCFKTQPHESLLPRWGSAILPVNYSVLTPTEICVCARRVRWVLFTLHRQHHGRTDSKLPNPRLPVSWKRHWWYSHWIFSPRSGPESISAVKTSNEHTFNCCPRASSCSSPTWISSFLCIVSNGTQSTSPLRLYTWISIKDAMRDSPDLATEAIKAELFLKRKLDSKGNFVKWKERLVAGGHLQPPTKPSSASTTTHSWSHRWSQTQVESGAYLLVDKTSEAYMTLKKALVDIIVTLDPSYSEFINQKGDIVVKFDKALYGCVESERLWFNDVASQSLEFMQSEVDPDGRWTHNHHDHLCRWFSLEFKGAQAPQLSH